MCGVETSCWYLWDEKWKNNILIYHLPFTGLRRINREMWPLHRGAGSTEAGWHLKKISALYCFNKDHAYILLSKWMLNVKAYKRLLGYSEDLSFCRNIWLQSVLIPFGAPESSLTMMNAAYVQVDIAVYRFKINSGMQ